MFHRVKSVNENENKDKEKDLLDEVNVDVKDESQSDQVELDVEAGQKKAAKETPVKGAEDAEKKEEPSNAPIYNPTPAASSSAIPKAADVAPAAASYTKSQPYAASASAPASTPAPQKPSQQYIVSGVSDEDRRLVISRGISIAGEIEACDHLLVEGTLEASLKDTDELHVAESGTFYGSVEVEQAIIAGRFEGDLLVNGRLTVRSTGVISGSVSYKELAVEGGAVIDGRVTPLSALDNAKPPKPSKGKKAKKDPGLFSGNEAA